MFFELLQVALGNRERLSRVPTAEEWEEIYEESGRQAVTGILLSGIDRLPLEQRPPKAILLQWIGVGQMIERRNQVMDIRCDDLLKMLKDQGIKGSILKGQGVALLYDKELRHLRQSGDIDVYVDCGQKKALAFAKSTGQKDIEWDYKHLHLNLWDNIEVEMHYRGEVLLNLWKNWRLQRWFKEHEAQIFGHTGCTETTDISCEHELPLINHEFSINAFLNTNRTNGTNGIVTPTVEFNVFFILLHIYRHFLYEGVGMRQIVDYYFVLKAISNADSTDKTDYAQEAVLKFGLEKFAKGLMWVMHEALGMPKEWMLWNPNQKEGEYILNQVMKGGNFGHYDARLKHGGGKLGAVKAILTHNLHLLTHYPADTIWAPIWIVWHKMWKIKTRMTL